MTTRAYVRQMVSALTCGMAVLALVGCATGGATATQGKAMEEGAAADSGRGSRAVDLIYGDTDVFDQRLSLAMSRNASPITLTTGEVNVHNLGERLETWFLHIERTRGVVEPKPIVAERTRSLAVISEVISLITQVAPSAFDRMMASGKKRSLYGPSRRYNALVYYYPDTKLVDRVEFVLRP